MKMYMFYDRCSGLFNNPFPAVNHEVAKRFFRHCCSGDTAYMAADLDLFYVGEVDEKTGVFTAPDKPEFLDRYNVPTACEV